MRASIAIPKLIGNIPLSGTKQMMAYHWQLLVEQVYKVMMLVSLRRRQIVLADPLQAWPFAECVRTSQARGKNCHLLELNLQTGPQAITQDD